MAKHDLALDLAALLAIGGCCLVLGFLAGMTSQRAEVASGHAIYISNVEFRCEQQ